MDSPAPGHMHTGAALAGTVAFGYTACSIVFWAWPDLAAGFMNGLFHGLDFRKLQTGATLFRFDGFAVALVSMTLWAFMLGTVFSWLRQRFSKKA